MIEQQQKMLIAMQDYLLQQKQIKDIKEKNSINL